MYKQERSKIHPREAPEVGPDVLDCTLISLLHRKDHRRGEISPTSQLELLIFKSLPPQWGGF